MKIKINEAENDYIRIGNTVIPKNAANYGYQNYDAVTRNAKNNYDKEKEAERKAAEEAEYRRKGKEFYDKFMKIYSELSSASTDELMENLFDEFVPGSGACESLGAEFIRAIERLRYRCYNDGDRFYQGYGIETCASSAAFIADFGGDKLSDEVNSIASDIGCQDEQYEQQLDKLASDVVEYLVNTPELFGKPVVDSRDYNSDLIEEWNDASHCLEYDPDVSGEYLDRLIDSGCIDWSDVESMLEDLASDWGGEVSSWARDAFTIIELDEDEYDEWDRYFSRTFNDWLDDLMSEYESELEDYENEDEEDYDEE